MHNQQQQHFATPAYHNSISGCLGEGELHALHKKGGLSQILTQLQGLLENSSAFVPPPKKGVGSVTVLNSGEASPIFSHAVQIFLCSNTVRTKNNEFLKK